MIRIETQPIAPKASSVQIKWKREEDPYRIEGYLFGVSLMLTIGGVVSLFLFTRQFPVILIALPLVFIIISISVRMLLAWCAVIWTASSFLSRVILKLIIRKNGGD